LSNAKDHFIKTNRSNYKKYQSEQYHTKLCFNTKFTVCNNKHEKLFTASVMNVTFIFETSLTAKPKEEKWSGHSILCSHPKQ